jgi:hypothetical protein
MWFRQGCRSIWGRSQSRQGCWWAGQPGIILPRRALRARRRRPTTRWRLEQAGEAWTSLRFWCKEIAGATSRCAARPVANGCGCTPHTLPPDVFPLILLPRPTGCPVLCVYRACGRFRGANAAPVEKSRQVVHYAQAARGCVCVRARERASERGCVRACCVRACVRAGQYSPGA